MVNKFLHSLLYFRFADQKTNLVVFSFAAGLPIDPFAGVAQLVEQLICNHQVVGSSPITGSSIVGPSSQIGMNARLAV